MDRDTLRTELDYDIDEDDFYWEESACREVISRLEDKVIESDKRIKWFEEEAKQHSILMDKFIVLIDR